MNDDNNWIESNLLDSEYIVSMAISIKYCHFHYDQTKRDPHRHILNVNADSSVFIFVSLEENSVFIIPTLRFLCTIFLQHELLFQENRDKKS